MSDKKFDIEEERILHAIQTIKEHISFIKSEEVTSAQILKQDKKLYLAVSMALFTIQNKLLELSEEVIDSLNKGLYAKKYLDIVDFLFQEKIIDSSTYKLFKDFVMYRNEIAHEYEGISENEIFWCIEHLHIVEGFVAQIVKKYISS